MAAPAERRPAAETQNGMGDVLASIRRMIVEDGSPMEGPGPSAPAMAAAGHPGVLRLEAPLTAAPPPLVLADPVAAEAPVAADAPDPALSRLTWHDSPESARLRATALRDALRARIPCQAVPAEEGRNRDMMPDTAATSAGVPESEPAVPQNAVAGTGGAEAFCAGAAPAEMLPAEQVLAAASARPLAEAPAAPAPAVGSPVAPAASWTVAAGPAVPPVAPMPTWGLSGPVPATEPAMAASGQPVAAAVHPGTAPWPAAAPTPALQPVFDAMAAPAPSPDSAAPPAATVDAGPGESFFAEVIREVVRQELRGEDSGRASQALRTMVLREVARAITGGPL